MSPWKVPNIWQRTESILEGGYDWPRFRWRRLPAVARQWKPAVEVYERSTEVLVRVELPGIRIDDVRIILEGATLKVSGERRVPHLLPEAQCDLCEILEGKFHRQIELPHPVKGEGARSHFEAGVLQVRLLKAERPISGKVNLTPAGHGRQTPD